MHITSTALMAIMAWRVDRRLGVAMWLYTVLIVIGSILLAWHYAVDGIAGVVLAFVFWWAAAATLRLFAARARADTAQAAAY
jgi:drug/metabolite transporter (DMT)-like permease